MSEVFPRDILLRVGGRALERGVLAIAGAGRRQQEVVETFSRADASTCATYIDRDGIIRLAAANKPRIEWVDLDGDGVRETPGILFEGSRTNLIENGDYEADAVGSSASGGSTLVRDTTQFKRGAAALKITTANSSSSGAFIHNRAGTRIAATVGTAYTFSPWVYAPAASVGKTVKVRIEWWSSAPAFLSATEVIGIVLVAGWQRLSVSGVAPASTATADPFVGGDTAQGVWDMWIDLAQFEPGAFASSAIPTGTAAVTRAADSLTVPFNFGPLPEGLSVLMDLARPVHADAVGSIVQVNGIFDLGNAASDHAWAYFEAGSRALTFAIQPAGGGGSAPAGSPLAIPAGNRLRLLQQIKEFSTGPKVAADTGAGLTAFGGASANPLTRFSQQVLLVGDIINSGDGMFGVLFDLPIFRGLPSRAEAMAAADA